jgi:hypothetical protein
MMPKHSKFTNSRTGKQEDTMTFVPINSYKHKTDNTGRYINTDFDTTRGMSEVPNHLYDTSDRMKFIRDNNLEDLYDMIIQTMRESHAKYDNTGRLYNYHLPKIDSDTSSIISRIFKNGIKATLQAIWDNMTEVQSHDYEMVS